MSTLYSAKTAIKNGYDANVVRLGFIAHNISNDGSIGYKRTRARSEALPGSFSHLIQSKLAYSGSRATGMVDSKTSGIYRVSHDPLSASLVGTPGYFFLMNTATDGSGTNVLTDAGGFHKYLVPSANGNDIYLSEDDKFLMGWPYDPKSKTFATGVGPASTRPIHFSSQEEYVAEASTKGEIAANLPAEDKVGTKRFVDMEVFDGVSDKGHNVRFQFARTGRVPGVWHMTLSTKNGTITSPSGLDVTFDANGKIVTPKDAKVSVTWGGAGAQSTFQLDLGHLTQFGGHFAVRKASADGHALGKLIDIFFDKHGVVTGKFTNGLNRPIAKIPAASVRSPDNLITSDNTFFQASGRSGGINLTEMGMDVGRVQFRAGQLEFSNQDSMDSLQNMFPITRNTQALLAVNTSINKLVSATADIIR